MKQIIEIAFVEPRLTAIVPKKTTFANLSHDIPLLLDKVYEFLKSSHINKYGSNLCLYLDNDLNIEVGVEVFNKFDSVNNIICSIIPGGRVAQTTHTGPYEKLVQTHITIQEWCKDNNEKLAGPCWEIYGDWNDDSSKLDTEVYYLLEGKKINT